MRRFTSAEYGLLERLALVAREGPLAMPHFLAQIHFSEAAGRGLILQPQGRFGYCYLRPARFAQEGAEASERQALLSLWLLVSWLRREGYLALDHDGLHTEGKLCCVGELFNDVHITPTSIVLNREGDQTAEPHQVVNRHGKVIYQGFKLQGDGFEVAWANCRGVLQVSGAIDELLRPFHAPALAPILTPTPERAPATLSAPASPQQPPLLQDASPSPSVSSAPSKPLFDPAELPSKATVPSSSWSLMGLLRGLKSVGGLGLVVGAVRTALHLHALNWLLVAAMAGVGWVGWQNRDVIVWPWTTDMPASSLVPPPTDATATAALPATATAAPLTETSESQSAPTASAPSPVLVHHGVDISKWNGDWLEHLQGPLTDISFVLVRASDGLRPDTSFARHWAAASKVGLVRGSYHYYRVQVNPLAQVRLYLSVLGTLGAQDIAPVLDVEEQSFPASGTPASLAKVQTDLLTALEAIERQTGRTPMIYTNLTIGNRWLDDPRFSRFPLWIADWSHRDQPRLPTAWRERGHKFWQRTDRYALPAAGHVALDLDLFTGRREDMAR